MQVDYRRIRNALPEGRTLPEELWIRRHRGILVLLWVLAAIVPVFALVRGYPLGHLVLESAIGPVFALLATTSALGRRQRSVAASLGLLSCTAVLVHLSGGVIEMHFLFFVMVAVVALYQDWICFLAAIAYVLVHHGILGALDPSSVFNHTAALNHPWKWAAIHAFFITGISIACLVTWRLDENLLDRERRGGGAPARGDPHRGDAQRRRPHGRRRARPSHRGAAGHRRRHRPHVGRLRRLLLQRRRHPG